MLENHHFIHDFVDSIIAVDKIQFTAFHLKLGVYSLHKVLYENQICNFFVSPNYEKEIRILFEVNLGVCAVI